MDAVIFAGCEHKSPAVNARAHAQVERLSKNRMQYGTNNPCRT